MNEKYVIDGKVYAREILEQVAKKKGVSFQSYLKQSGAQTEYEFTRKQLQGDAMEGIKGRSDATSVYTHKPESIRQEERKEFKKKQAKKARNKGILKGIADDQVEEWSKKEDEVKDDVSKLKRKDAGEEWEEAKEKSIYDESVLDKSVLEKDSIYDIGKHPDREEILSDAPENTDLSFKEKKEKLEEDATKIIGGRPNFTKSKRRKLTTHQVMKAFADNDKIIPIGDAINLTKEINRSNDENELIKKISSYNKDMPFMQNIQTGSVIADLAKQAENNTYIPETFAEKSPGTTTSQQRHKAIQNAGIQEIYDDYLKINSEFDARELINKAGVTGNSEEEIIRNTEIATKSEAEIQKARDLYSLTREGKIGEYIQRAYFGTKKLEVDDYKYLKDYAPKAHKELLQHLGIKESTPVPEQVAIIQERARKVQKEHIESINNKSYNKALGILNENFEGGINPDKFRNLAYVNEFGEQLDKMQTKEKVESQNFADRAFGPKGEKVIDPLDPSRSTGDLGEMPVVPRYDKRYTEVREALTTVVANSMRIDFSKRYKAAKSDEAKDHIAKEFGKVLRNVDRDARAMSKLDDAYGDDNDTEDLLIHTGLMELSLSPEISEEVASKLEGWNDKNPRAMNEQIIRKLNLERYKTLNEFEKKVADAENFKVPFLPGHPFNKSWGDRHIEQLSAEEQRHYWKHTKKEINDAKWNNYYINGNGLVDAAFRSAENSAIDFVKGIGGTIPGIDRLVGRSAEDLAREQLNVYDPKAQQKQALGEDVNTEIKELREKVASGKAEIQDIDRLIDIDKYESSELDKWFRATGDLTGQVYYQAQTGLGVGSAMKYITTRASRVLLGNIARKAAVNSSRRKAAMNIYNWSKRSNNFIKSIPSLGKRESIAGMITTAFVVKEQAKKDAMLHFADSPEKQFMFQAATILMNGLSEHIFADWKLLKKVGGISEASQKMFSKGMMTGVSRKERNYLLKQIVNNLSQSGLKGDALKRQMVDDVKKLAYYWVKNNLEESVEEGVTDAGVGAFKLALQGNWDADDWNKEVLDAGLETAAHTYISSMAIVGPMGARRDWVQNKKHLSTYSQIGINKDFTKNIEREIYLQLREGNITDAEAIEKLRLMKTLATANQNVTQRFRHLSETKKSKLALLITSDKVLQEREKEGENKSVIAAERKKIDEKITKIVNGDVVVDENMRMYTIEEYNQFYNANKTGIPKAGFTIVKREEDEGEGFDIFATDGNSEEMFHLGSWETLDEAEAAGKQYFDTDVKAITNVQEDDNGFYGGVHFITVDGKGKASQSDVQFRTESFKTRKEAEDAVKKAAKNYIKSHENITENINESPAFGAGQDFQQTGTTAEGDVEVSDKTDDSMFLSPNEWREHLQEKIDRAPNKETAAQYEDMLAEFNKANPVKEVEETISEEVEVEVEENVKDEDGNQEYDLDSKGNPIISSPTKKLALYRRIIKQHEKRNSDNTQNQIDGMVGIAEREGKIVGEKADAIIALNEAGIRKATAEELNAVNALRGQKKTEMVKKKKTVKKKVAKTVEARTDLKAAQETFTIEKKKFTLDENGNIVSGDIQKLSAEGAKELAEIQKKGITTASYEVEGKRYNKRGSKFYDIYGQEVKNLDVYAELKEKDEKANPKEETKKTEKKATRTATKATEFPIAVQIKVKGRKRTIYVNEKGDVSPKSNVTGISAQELNRTIDKTISDKGEVEVNGKKYTYIADQYKNEDGELITNAKERAEIESAKFKAQSDARDKVTKSKQLVATEAAEKDVAEIMDSDAKDVDKKNSLLDLVRSRKHAYQTIKKVLEGLKFWNIDFAKNVFWANKGEVSAKAKESLSTDEFPSENFEENANFLANKERFEEASTGEGETKTIMLPNGELVDVVGGYKGKKRTLSTPDGGKVTGHYVLMDARGVSPSHTTEFKKHPGVPVKTDGTTNNDNNYEIKPGEKEPDAVQKVKKYAEKYDRRAVEDPPKVDENGVVKSGTNRTLSRQLTTEAKSADYNEGLNEDLGMYGINLTQEQWDQLDKANVMVVFVMDGKPAYSKKEYSQWNVDDKKKKTSAQDAANVIDSLSEEQKSQVLSFYQTKDYKKLHEMLKEFLGETEMVTFMTEDGLEARGQQILENLYLTTVFGPELTKKLNKEANAKLRLKLIESRAGIIGNWRTANDFNQIGNIKEAIEFGLKDNGDFSFAQTVLKFIANFKAFLIGSDTKIPTYDQALWGIVLRKQDVLNRALRNINDAANKPQITGMFEAVEPIVTVRSELNIQAKNIAGVTDQYLDEMKKNATVERDDAVQEEQEPPTEAKINTQNTYTYRRLIKEGASYGDILAKMAELGDTKHSVWLAYLNPDGTASQAASRDEVFAAALIGELRKDYPQMTDSQEQQLYEFMLAQDVMPTRENMQSGAIGLLIQQHFTSPKSKDNFDLSKGELYSAENIKTGADYYNYVTKKLIAAQNALAAKKKALEAKKENDDGSEGLFTGLEKITDENINNATKEDVAKVEALEAEQKRALKSMQSERFLFIPKTQHSKQQKNLAEYIKDKTGTEIIFDEDNSRFKEKMAELGWTHLGEMQDGIDSIKLVYKKGKDGKPSTVAGFTDGGKIYIEYGSMSEGLLLHENYHVFEETLLQAAINGNVQAKALIKKRNAIVGKTVSKWKEVILQDKSHPMNIAQYWPSDDINSKDKETRDKAYADWEEKLRGEAMARMIEKNGDSFMERFGFSNKAANKIIKTAQEWFGEFAAWIGKAFNIDATPEQITAMTTNQFLDHMTSLSLQPRVGYNSSANESYDKVTGKSSPKFSANEMSAANSIKSMYERRDKNLKNIQAVYEWGGIKESFDTLEKIGFPSKPEYISIAVALTQIKDQTVEKIAQNIVKNKFAESESEFYEIGKENKIQDTYLELKTRIAAQELRELKPYKEEIETVKLIEDEASKVKLSFSAESLPTSPRQNKNHQKISNYAKQIQNGQIKIERGNKATEDGRRQSGRANVEATIYLSTIPITKRTDDQDQAPIKAFKQFIINNGLHIDSQSADNFGERIDTGKPETTRDVVLGKPPVKGAKIGKYGNFMTSGYESEVFFKDNSDSVFKRRESYDDLNELLDDLDRISANNGIFNPKYVVEGFDVIGNDLRGYTPVMILKQPLIIQDPKSKIVPQKEILEEVNRVFESKGIFGTAEGSLFKSPEYIVHDIYNANVIKGTDGDLYFIDLIVKDKNISDYNLLDDLDRNNEIDNVKFSAESISTYKRNGGGKSSAISNNSFQTNIEKFNDIAPTVTPKFSAEEVVQQVAAKVANMVGSGRNNELFALALSQSPKFGDIKVTKSINTKVRERINAIKKELAEIYKGDGDKSKAEALKTELKEANGKLKETEVPVKLSIAEAEQILIDEINAIEDKARNTDDYYIKDFHIDFLKAQAESYREQNDELNAQLYEKIIESEYYREQQLKEERKEQRARLLGSIDYLKDNPDYSNAFHYVVLKAILGKTATTQGDIINRTPTTVLPHNEIWPGNAPQLQDLLTSFNDTPFNANIVAEIAEIIKASAPSPVEIKEIVDKYKVEERPNGTWVKFPQTSDGNLEEGSPTLALHRLAKDSHKHDKSISCAWCTGSTTSFATSHIGGGDFYIFVDNTNTARIAMRYLHGRILEARGVGYKQFIEDDWRYEEKYFYDNYPGGKEKLDTYNFNRLYKKIKNDENLSDEEIIELYEIKDVGDGSYDGTGSAEKVREVNQYVKDNFEPIAEIYAKKYNVNRDEVFVPEMQTLTLDSTPPKVVIGDFYKDDFRDWSKVVHIQGQIVGPSPSTIRPFSKSSLIELPNLETVSKGVENVNAPKLREAGKVANSYTPNLESVESTLTVRHRENTNYSKLKKAPQIVVKNPNYQGEEPVEGIEIKFPALQECDRIQVEARQESLIHFGKLNKLGTMDNRGKAAIIAPELTKATEFKNRILKRSHYPKLEVVEEGVVNPEAGNKLTALRKVHNYEGLLSDAPNLKEANDIFINGFVMGVPTHHIESVNDIKLASQVMAEHTSKIYFPSLTRANTINLAPWDTKNPAISVSAPNLNRGDARIIAKTIDVPALRVTDGLRSTDNEIHAPNLFHYNGEYTPTKGIHYPKLAIIADFKAPTDGEDYTGMHDNIRVIGHGNLDGFTGDLPLLGVFTGSAILDNYRYDLPRLKKIEGPVFFGNWKGENRAELERKNNLNDKVALLEKHLEASVGPGFNKYETETRKERFREILVRQLLDTKKTIYLKSDHEFVGEMIGKDGKAILTEMLEDVEYKYDLSKGYSRNIEVGEIIEFETMNGFVKLEVVRSNDYEFKAVIPGTVQTVNEDEHIESLAKDQAEYEWENSGFEDGQIVTDEQLDEAFAKDGEDFNLAQAENPLLEEEAQYVVDKDAILDKLKYDAWEWVGQEWMTDFSEGIEWLDEPGERNRYNFDYEYVVDNTNEDGLNPAGLAGNLLEFRHPEVTHAWEILQDHTFLSDYEQEQLQDKFNEYKNIIRRLQHTRGYSNKQPLFDDDGRPMINDNVSITEDGSIKITPKERKTEFSAEVAVGEMYPNAVAALSKLPNTPRKSKEWVNGINQSSGATAQTRWIKLDEHLEAWEKENEGKLIPKSVVEEILKINAIQVQTVNINDEIDNSHLDQYKKELEDMEDYELAEEISSALGIEPDDIADEREAYIEQAVLEMEDLYASRMDDPQTEHGNYTLDGHADNYTELLLKYPDTDTEAEAIILREESKKFMNSRKYVEGGYEYEYGGKKYKVEGIGIKPVTAVDYYQQYVYKGEGLDLVESSLANIEGVLWNKIKPKPKNKTYTEPHWPIRFAQNTFAHSRVDERTVNGERVLFVNELQSQWNKENRETDKLKKSRKAILDDIEKLSINDAIKNHFIKYDSDLNHISYAVENGGEDYIENVDNPSKGEMVKKVIEHIEGILNVPVTDLPHNNTNLWTNLMIRRTLQYASQRGLSQVVFPTGSQQQEIQQWGIDEYEKGVKGAKAYYDGIVTKLLRKEAARIGATIEQNEWKIRQTLVGYEAYPTFGKIVGTGGKDGSPRDFVEKDATMSKSAAQTYADQKNTEVQNTMIVLNNDVESIPLFSAEQANLFDDDKVGKTEKIEFSKTPASKEALEQIGMFGDEDMQASPTANPTLQSLFEEYNPDKPQGLTDEEKEDIKNKLESGFFLQEMKADRITPGKLNILLGKAGLLTFESAYPDTPQAELRELSDEIAKNPSVGDIYKETSGGNWFRITKVTNSNVFGEWLDHKKGELVKGKARYALSGDKLEQYERPRDWFNAMLWERAKKKAPKKARPRKDYTQAGMFEPETGEGDIQTEEFAKYEGGLGLDILPDTESIEALNANFNSGEILDGLRVVDISEFDTISPNKRVNSIAEKISESGEYSPIVIGKNLKGDVWILEGQHRASALKKLGYSEIPVKVVLETAGEGDIQETPQTFISEANLSDALRETLEGEEITQENLAEWVDNETIDEVQTDFGSLYTMPLEQDPQFKDYRGGIEEATAALEKDAKTNDVNAPGWDLMSQYKEQFGEQPSGKLFDTEEQVDKLNTTTLPVQIYNELEKMLEPFRAKLKKEYAIYKNADSDIDINKMDVKERMDDLEDEIATAENKYKENLKTKIKNTYPELSDIQTENVANDLMAPNASDLPLYHIVEQRKAKYSAESVEVYTSANAKGEVVYFAENESWADGFSGKTKKATLNLSNANVFDMEYWNKKLELKGIRPRFLQNGNVFHQAGDNMTLLGGDGTMAMMHMKAPELYEQIKEAVSKADVIKGYDTGVDEMTYAVINKSVINDDTTNWSAEGIPENSPMDNELRDLIKRAPDGLTYAETLQQIADTDHVLSDMAHKLLNSMDKSSLGMRIKYGEFDAKGEYNQGTDETRISDTGGIIAAMHEIVHGATIRKLPKSIAESTLTGELYDDLLRSYLNRPVGDDVKRIIRTYLQAKKYLNSKDVNGQNVNGLLNLKEFISETITNPEFQSEIKKLGPKNESIFQSFVNVIAKWLGIDRSVLNNVISSTLFITGESRIWGKSNKELGIKDIANWARLDNYERWRRINQKIQSSGLEIDDKTAFKPSEEKKIQEYTEKFQSNDEETDINQMYKYLSDGRHSPRSRAMVIAAIKLKLGVIDDANQAHFQEKPLDDFLQKYRINYGEQEGSMVLSVYTTEEVTGIPIPDNELPGMSLESVADNVEYIMTYAKGIFGNNPDLYIPAIHKWIEQNIEEKNGQEVYPPIASLLIIGINNELRHLQETRPSSSQKWSNLMNKNQLFHQEAARETAYRLNWWRALRELSKEEYSGAGQLMSKEQKRAYDDIMNGSTHEFEETDNFDMDDSYSEKDTKGRKKKSSRGANRSAKRKAERNSKKKVDKDAFIDKAKKKCK